MLKIVIRRYSRLIRMGMIYAYKADLIIPGILFGFHIIFRKDLKPLLLSSIPAIPNRNGLPDFSDITFPVLPKKKTTTFIGVGFTGMFKYDFFNIFYNRELHDSLDFNLAACETNKPVKCLWNPSGDRDLSLPEK